jgi:hypothetical protein
MEKPRRMGPRFREDDFYQLAASSRSSVNSRIAASASIGLAEGETSGNDVTLNSKTRNRQK